MITVCFKENDQLSLTLNGHAEFSECGSDIVCSAISTLAYTLASYLERNSTACKKHCIIKKGYAEFFSKAPEDKEMFHLIFSIIHKISQQYPNNVKII